MFNKFKAFFHSLITTRILYFIILLFAGFSVLFYRIFQLQIVHGEEYLNSFQVSIKKERNVEAARGNIYDCNGVLLAYNQLAYSVKIEDVYESGKNKNKNLNNTILKTIKIVESNGDKLALNFNISVDDEDNYVFTVSDSLLSRFKADIFGYAFINDMTYAESSASADDIMEYLTGKKRYNIDTENLSKQEIIKLVSVRYAMSLNAYQKYIATTIATNVNEKTVATIYENADVLEGVSIAEDTIRVYPQGEYMAQIIGYTGKINADELKAYSASDDTYNMNDIVGKVGIEKSMESALRGLNGSETVFVDTLGRVVSIDSYTYPVAGNDVYLTIDSKLQESIYHVLEQKLAGILLKKIVNTKVYVPGEKSSASDIVIPIYDVYYQMFNNNIIDVKHLQSDDASENERDIYQAFLYKQSKVMERLLEELTTKKTVYNKLTTEYKVYENYIEDILLDADILVYDLIDSQDDVYRAWAIDETISLNQYINYAISKGWINNKYLNLETAYSESSEIYDSIVSIVLSKLEKDENFHKILYKYIIREDLIRPRQICDCLLDQGIISLSEEEQKLWERNAISPYNFMIERISNLEITPAQLALDPCSASMVVTDVNNGSVLACVSYPSYDNNYLANGADAAYLKKVNNDKSLPLINFATQQRTAPGSTYKMVSAAAGLCEGVVNTNTLITCVGTFDEITEKHNCWIYPGRHGALNVANAIKASCNYYFYTVGYRLSLDENNNYNSSLGVEKLNKYADMFGLTDKSGIEIEEYSPHPTTDYSVPSAIGQGTNSFTTVGLARYVTAVANSGTVYNLTLLDKLVDSNGNDIVKYNAEIRNTIDMDERYWDAIHDGMKKVVESKYYFQDLGIEFAGKTGTAQQSKTRPDHGLFVCYAPYKDPEIAIAVRIANGYTSEYVADTTKDVLKLYFNLEKKDDIVTGSAAEINANGHGGD